MVSNLLAICFFLKHRYAEHRNCGSKGMRFVLQIHKLRIQKCLDHWAAIIINSKAIEGHSKRGKKTRFFCSAELFPKAMPTTIHWAVELSVQVGASLTLSILIVTLADDCSGLSWTESPILTLPPALGQRDWLETEFYPWLVTENPKCSKLLDFSGKEAPD